MLASLDHHREFHRQDANAICSRAENPRTRDARSRTKPTLFQLIATLFFCVAICFGISPTKLSAQIQIQTEDLNEPIRITAKNCEHWTEGVYEVWSMTGGCEIVQGRQRSTSNEAVLWFEKSNPNTFEPWKVRAYLEGNVLIERAAKSPQPATSLQPTDKIQSANWFGEFRTHHEPRIKSNSPEIRGEVQVRSPQERRAVYERAMQNFVPKESVVNSLYSHQVADAHGSSLNKTSPSNAVKRTEFAIEFPNVTQNLTQPPQSATPGVRRVRFSPRSAVPTNLQAIPTPGSAETIIYSNSGVQLLIDGLGSGQPGPNAINTIDISADKIVVWTQGTLEELANGQDGNIPLELYLEGDIVFREGERIIYAQAMYYNVVLRTGTILNAEIVSRGSNFAGVARLKADVVRQINDSNYVANGASLTTSRLAMPSYEFRSGQLTMNITEVPATDPVTGFPLINPATGEQQFDRNQQVVSTNNVVFLDGLPIFYWPQMATDLEDPTFYIKDITLGTDRVYGNRVNVTFDAYQVFGVKEKPKGTNWEFDLGYMDLRGFTAGTRFDYSRPLFGQNLPAFGLFDSFYVNDSGKDRLGPDRFNITPEEEHRYRILGKHRQLLDNGWQVTAELGLISDRNFLESFKEREWDDQKDQATGIEFKRMFDNKSFAASVDYNPNEFFLRTQQLPRLDYFSIADSFFQDRVTSYTRIHGGYSESQIASTPTDLKDAATFSPLPYEREVSGENFAWRQGFELPIDVLDLKVIPFLRGEAAHWGSDLNGDDIQRFYGQGGIRTSLPFVGYAPDFHSDLLNVHGVAHKVNFDVEYSYTDASKNVDELPLYEEIDDDNVQHFRRRLAFQDFGGPAPVPRQFDERFYGVRRGLQDNVTGPTEIVDDLQVVRLGLRQRWQTKRGSEANRRIVDWVTFDTHFELFPDQNDNFGENAGLFDYDFRWHVGDRVTLMSDGAADFFVDGQRYYTVGAYLSRPQRGNIFVGYRKYDGPFDANVLLSTINYRLSAKWAASAGLSFDLTNNGYMGQTLSLTRIGESFLFTAAFQADQVRDNVGINFFLEPRFFPRTQFGKKTNLSVPQAGQYGLE